MRHITCSIKKAVVALICILLAVASPLAAIAESYTAVVAVTADGTLLEDPPVQWTSSDPVVASVDDGVITAQKAGKTTITSNCQYGGKTASAKFKVTVTKAEVMLEPETPVVLDLSEEDGGLVAFTFPMDVTGVGSVTVGNGEYRIVPQGDQVLIQATYLTPGEYIMTVEQDTQYTSFPVYIASMVIRSAEDLQKATRMSGADKGYFVLGNNIDCAELTEPICFTANSVSENHLGQNRAGFLGGFNGMGYTISNLKVPENGLFGCIAGCGIVRNVGFADVKAEVDNVVCLYNAGLISQVYVQGDFSQVLQHSFGPDNKLKNIVAETTRSGALLSGNIASVNTTGYCVSDVYALIMPVMRNTCSTIPSAARPTPCWMITCSPWVLWKLLPRTAICLPVRKVSMHLWSLCTTSLPSSSMAHSTAIPLQ